MGARGQYDVTFRQDLGDVGLTGQSDHDVQLPTLDRVIVLHEENFHLVFENVRLGGRGGESFCITNNNVGRRNSLPLYLDQVVNKVRVLAHHLHEFHPYLQKESKYGES